MNELPQYDPDANSEPVIITIDQWRLVNDEIDTLIKGHNRLVKRIGALEDGTPEPEFEPCRYAVYHEQDIRIIEISIDGNGKTANLWLSTELAGIEMNAKELRQLIDAVQAVLKRIEAEQSDED
jgi:hypothetical protein